MNARNILKNSLILALFILILKIVVEPLFTDGAYLENIRTALNKMFQRTSLLIWLGVSLLVGILRTYIRRNQ